MGNSKKYISIHCNNIFISVSGFPLSNYSTLSGSGVLFVHLGFKIHNYYSVLENDAIGRLYVRS